MNTQWSKRRRVVYGAGFLVALVLLFTYFYRDTLFPTPTCSDGKQNGYESGVDCGGTCSLRCAQEVIPISVSWARAVRTSSTTYDLVALLSNKNIDNAPRGLSYVFTVYTKDGKQMLAVQGTTIVPVDGDFPVIKQNVILPEEPGEVSATVSANVPHYKALEKPTEPTIRVSNTRFEAGSISRVYARITNTKRVSLRSVPVRVLLYEASGNVFGVGETIIPELGKESAEDVVFTWKNAFEQTPTKITVVPILDPFLGSQ